MYSIESPKLLREWISELILLISTKNLFNYLPLRLSITLYQFYLYYFNKNEKNFIKKNYYSNNYKTLRKYWVTEDGGRLFKKRNLHWIVNSNINTDKIPGINFKWMTLWQIREFIKKKDLS